ncbi:MAG: hypothetical protein SPH79_03475 [Schaalia hyovaginalis]|nr:hypothetical protein [Schaalia hyovaginalis]MDY6213535.1 hypothetical protein [Schaalia hyovaginalis]
MPALLEELAGVSMMSAFIRMVGDEVQGVACTTDSVVWSLSV